MYVRVQVIAPQVPRVSGARTRALLRFLGVDVYGPFQSLQGPLGAFLNQWEL